ncbi:MAG: rhodanese-like domain-containing protein [Candidatus Chlorobium antarcticum]|jgi:rhodanese-related sulfurtransferase|nr:rhodanese-like domain-containing protein [Candidatus Chlorobium antarcticum]
MLTVADLLSAALLNVAEIMPWDLVERMKENPELLLLDVREPHEFAAMHIPGSLHVARGVLEAACEWDFDDTCPELVRARSREIVVVCRSGHRSAFAAEVMQRMGYSRVVSLKTGLRGWNDYEEPLLDGGDRPVEADEADSFFLSQVRDDQKTPKE